jgi:hypothetical protein
MPVPTFDEFGIRIPEALVTDLDPTRNYQEHYPIMKQEGLTRESPQCRNYASNAVEIGGYAAAGSVMYVVM